MRALLILAFVVTCSSLPAQDETETRTWQGKWNNRKYGTTGPLKCVAKHDGNGNWDATFTGTFKGDPFEYKAHFQSKPGKGVTDLSGKAVIRGHDYEWAGAIKGNLLRGRYRSSVGYFGEFEMKEAAARNSE